VPELLQPTMNTQCCWRHKAGTDLSKDLLDHIQAMSLRRMLNQRVVALLIRARRFNQISDSAIWKTP